MDAALCQWIYLFMIHIILQESSTCASFSSLLLRSSLRWRASVTRLRSNETGLLWLPLKTRASSQVSVSNHPYPPSNYFILNVLTDLNAVTRAIDLACKLLAPTTVGLIMTFGSDKMAAVVIAVWNVVSLVAESLLLRKVYALVPALAVKNAGLKTPQLSSFSAKHEVN